MDAADFATAPRSRVLTIPNVISIVRLALVPVFLYLVWGLDEGVWAAALLAVLGATDWVDGYIARHFDQGSELGKVLDPMADRALLVAAVVVLLTLDISTPVNIWLWLALIREVLIAVVTVALGIAGARRIDVVWAGKAGTLALMFALPMFLVADAAESVRPFFNFVGWGFAIGGIILGYYAVWKYVPAARAALQEGRAARSHAEATRSEVQE